jgi:hypothetical protein
MAPAESLPFRPACGHILNREEGAIRCACNNPVEPMLAFEFVAVLAATLFAGVATYVSLVERHEWNATPTGCQDR